jgi:hypothetical protein
MTADTKQLIRELTDNVKPVRRPARPFVRTLAWLGVSLGYILIFIVLMPAHRDLRANAHNDLFLVEQAAAFATGLTAAIAAFVSVIPGYSRRWALLPALPFAVWLASLGPGCNGELDQFGIANLPLGHNPWCAPFIVLFGALPAAAITVMLRRGAPLTPRLTAALGGLAAAGLANVGVRIVHPEDVSIMLLVWHVGVVLALSALAGAYGRYFFNWPSLIKKSRIGA